MATQRIVCLKSGYAISFMGDEQELTSGDGINTFEVKVFKHHLDLEKAIDFFDETIDLGTIDPGTIDFKHLVFEMKSVPLDEIKKFFNAFVI